MIEEITHLTEVLIPVPLLQEDPFYVAVFKCSKKYIFFVSLFFDVAMCAPFCVIINAYFFYSIRTLFHFMSQCLLLIVLKNVTVP